MQLQSLNCNNCGAQLHVSETARFVTCAHCDAQLAIHRNENSLYTEQIAELKEATAEIADHVAQLAYDNKLQRIDEEWEDEEAGYMIRNQHGRDVPPAVQLLISGAVALVGVVLAAVSPWPFKMFPLFAVLAGGGGMIVGVIKARNYEHAYQRYLNRRDSVKLEDFMPRSRRKNG